MFKVLLSAAIALFAQADASANTSVTLKDLLQMNKYRYSALNLALEVANLTDALAGAGPLTLLAPTNDAFDKLVSRSAFVNLLRPENRDELVKVLTYHVLPKKYEYADWVAYSSVKPLEGEDIVVFVYDDPKVVDFNMQATTYPSAYREATNGAFYLLDDGILIPGSIQPDLKQTFDIFEPTVGEIVTARGYSTISTLLEAGGLISTLYGPGPWTVFAPTDDAFAALDTSVLLHLLDPANIKDLQAVLEYHVVPVQAITASGDVKTAQGQTVSIDFDGKVASVNKIATGLGAHNATNGGVFELEGILIPPSLKELFAK